MQYHLDTIPVWDAMKAESECPLCTLRRKTELMQVERSLGGSVMEPSSRIRMNEKGVCREHQQMLFSAQNRLGHALLMDSHAIEVLSQLESIGGIRGAKGFLGRGKNVELEAAAQKLEKLSSGCVLCEEIDGHMERYAYTFVQLWKSDEGFRKKLSESKGCCMPHTAQLLRFAKRTLTGEKQGEFATQMLSLLLSNLTQSHDELKYFTQKFDYRNQDKPWGNSKTALERVVNRLRGWCVGKEPLEK